MKNLLLSAFIMAALCAATSTRAELVAYKGTLKANYIGGDHTVTVNFKSIIIVDHDTANVKELLYATINHQKLYSTGTESNLHFVEVTGAKSKGYLAISRPASDCDETNGIDGEDVFAQGAVADLTLDTNNTVISFPKTLSTVGQAYSDSALVTHSGKMNFDKTRTLNSNNAGQTLDQALDDAIAFVQSLGYSEASSAASTSALGKLRSAAAAVKDP